MDVLLTIAGAALAGVGLHDMFHSLMHPSGRGHVSRWVMSGVWRVSKMFGRRLGAVVGPAAMVAVVLAWVAFQAVGWALIYLPHVPGGFAYSAGVDHAAYPDPAGALYVSLVTLSTLGFGDVVPTGPWVRLAVPAQGLVGFALLTSALTWFSRIYAPLARRRSLALEIKSLEGVRFADRFRDVDPPEASRVLDGLAAQLGMVRIDFTQHTESYYFREIDADLSLPHWLPCLVPLADAAASSPALGVRLSGQRVFAALEQLAAKLRSDFVRTGTTPAEVFAAYAADHQRGGGS